LNKSAIARAKRIAWNTVDRWLQKAAFSCRRFNDQKIDGIPISELQADEIRTIIHDNGNGFDGLQTVDFDQDGIEDAVATAHGVLSTRFLMNHGIRFDNCKLRTIPAIIDPLFVDMRRHCNQ
jgi:hypothetical protein